MCQEEYVQVKYPSFIIIIFLKLGLERGILFSPYKVMTELVQVSVDAPFNDSPDILSPRRLYRPQTDKKLANLLTNYRVRRLKVFSGYRYAYHVPTSS